MPVARGTLSVTPTSSQTIPLGSATTVGAVVILNESPYALNVGTGASTQWIAAQTGDMVPCASQMGFNGNLTITTSDYLDNATSAPSFLVLLTTYAPGETIPGTYPFPLARLTNGGNVGIASQLVNDGSPSGTNIIESTPSGAAGSYFLVTNNGNVTMRGQLTIAFRTGLLPPSATVSDNGNDLAFVIGGLAGPGADGGYAFTAIFNGNTVVPFGIAQSPGVNPLSWVDAAGILHATAPVMLASGHQETGAAGLEFTAAGANVEGAYMVNFKTTMTQTPSSITLTVGFSGNFHGLSADSIGVNGFRFVMLSTAAGLCQWIGSYTTVGNCLLAVNALARTFDHHCDACGAVHRGVSLAALDVRRGPTPARSGLSYTCPECDASEHFNCALTAADELDATPQGSGEYLTTRGAQATYIRQLMSALALGDTTP